MAPSRSIATRRSGYTHDVDIDDGRHTIVIDEPESAGGAGEGPSPTRLLGAALAACTAITIEMYADRKGWDVGNLRVETEVAYEGAVPSEFTVVLHLPGGLTEEQQEKLRVIAGRCPVHRTLAAEMKVSIVDRVAPAG
jgi:putative redox protein